MFRWVTSVNTYSVQLKESQNKVKQYLEWNSFSDSFSVYWHIGAKTFDQIIGTVKFYIVMSGYIELELKDIVQETI